MSLNVCIIGGHGKVALRLARLLASARHSVTSVVRDESHASDIRDVGAKPLVLSLEDSPVSAFSNEFADKNVVVFSAGAGGKGDQERTKKVDYEGALKVFDAIEQVNGFRPRLILISGVDVRHPDHIPSHYTEADLEVSRRIRASLATWFHWKYEADKNLAKRTAFKWSILRPGGLLDAPGIGKASIGRTALTNPIARDDIAQALFLLVTRQDGDGLALDIVGGDTPIEEALDAAITKGETDLVIPE